VTTDVLPAAGRAGPSASAAEIDLFRDLLLKVSGVHFGRQREAFLESRLRRRMRQVGARSFYEYYRRVAGAQATPGELQALVNSVSIHETAFFRNPAQFHTLEKVAIPERVRTRLREGRRRLYVWSAGCSTGQEPYSVAMSLFDTTSLPEAWDIRITATDISTDALRRARAGSYADSQVAEVGPERRRRFFTPSGDAVVVRPWLRARVDFVQANVLDGPPGFDLDIIFCRNLMIYFDSARQRQLVATLSRALAPGGYLFLGHTESVGALTEELSMVSRENGIAYRRRS
jgi:chemotaxis protein methyltransferase CheR